MLATPEKSQNNLYFLYFLYFCRLSSKESKESKGMVCHPPILHALGELLADGR